MGDGISRTRFVQAAHDVVDAYIFGVKVRMGERTGSMGGIRGAQLEDLRVKSRKHYERCMEELQRLSFQERGILPHGVNGKGPIHPMGTRPHSELKELQERLVALGGADGEDEE